MRRCHWIAPIASYKIRLRSDIICSRSACSRCSSSNISRLSFTIICQVQRQQILHERLARCLLNRTENSGVTRRKSMREVFVESLAKGKFTINVGRQRRSYVWNYSIFQAANEGNELKIEKAERGSVERALISSPHPWLRSSLRRRFVCYDEVRVEGSHVAILKGSPTMTTARPSQDPQQNSFHSFLFFEFSRTARLEAHLNMFSLSFSRLLYSSMKNESARDRGMLYDV